MQRLTAQPEYVGAPWIDPRLARHVTALADPATGLAPRRQSGRAAVAGARRRWVNGRRTGRAAPTCTRRSTPRAAPDRRSDFDEVYGDWEAIPRKVHASGQALRAAGRRAAGRLPPGRPEPASADVFAPRSAAERDPAGCTDAEASRWRPPTAPRWRRCRPG